MTKQLLGWARDFNCSNVSAVVLGPIVFLFNQKKTVIYSELKWPRHEANYLLPSSVEDNEWSYTSSACMFLCCEQAQLHLTLF
jgi:hypothetical protein